MEAASKDIFILGGPNGAGKTTAARVLLPDFYKLRTFLNADEIAREISPRNPETVAFAAGRELITRMHRLIRADQSFAFETTCAGKVYPRLLEQCAREGWRITLLYFWLASPELAVSRVARRVSEGGHDIPSDTIHRRYWTGIRNMRNLYLPLAEEAEIYDNSNTRRILIAEKREGSILAIRDAQRWARIEGVYR